MNILRYKWPAVVAAGLHGALFIITPHAHVISDPGTIETPALPPIPKDPDPIIQIDDPDTDCNAPIAPTVGGPSVPSLPEPLTPLKDDQAITVPVIEHPSVTPIDNTLKDYRGGPAGPGRDWGPRTAPISLSKDLDRTPRATVQMSPEYPPAMRQIGTAGSVMVEFDVDTEGRVVRAGAVNYTHREFVEPAVRAVLKWRFEPGRRHGRAVPFRMVIPMEFTLGAD